MEKKYKSKLLKELSENKDPFTSSPLLRIILGVIFIIISICLIPIATNELLYSTSRYRVIYFIFVVIGIAGGFVLIIHAIISIRNEKKIKDIEFEIDKRISS